MDTYYKLEKCSTLRCKTEYKGTRGIEFGNVQLYKFSKNPTLSEMLLESLPSSVNNKWPGISIVDNIARTS